MTETFLFDSPAKVNLTLEILRKRDDGYHELRTLLQKISLHDTLRFHAEAKKGDFHHDNASHAAHRQRKPGVQGCSIHSGKIGLHGGG